MLSYYWKIYGTVSLYLTQIQKTFWCWMHSKYSYWTPALITSCQLSCAVKMWLMFLYVTADHWLGLRVNYILLCCSFVDEESVPSHSRAQSHSYNLAEDYTNSKCMQAQHVIHTNTPHVLIHPPQHTHTHLNTQRHMQSHTNRAFSWGLAGAVKTKQS